jgi:hypothetical protein
MCSLCGALGHGPAWEQEGLAGQDARWQLRREAAAMAAELTRLLHSRRIKVTAHDARGFVVAFPTGRTAMAAGLNEVWHLLDRARVAVPDPLEA